VYAEIYNSQLVGDAAADAVADGQAVLAAAQA